MNTHETQLASSADNRTPETWTRAVLLVPVLLLQLATSAPAIVDRDADGVDDRSELAEVGSDPVLTEADEDVLIDLDALAEEETPTDASDAITVENAVNAPLVDAWRAIAQDRVPADAITGHPMYRAKLEAAAEQLRRAEAGDLDSWNEFHRLTNGQAPTLHEQEVFVAGGGPPILDMVRQVELLGLAGNDGVIVSEATARRIAQADADFGAALGGDLEAYRRFKAAVSGVLVDADEARRFVRQGGPDILGIEKQLGLLGLYPPPQHLARLDRLGRDLERALAGDRDSAARVEAAFGADPGAFLRVRDNDLAAMRMFSDTSGRNSADSGFAMFGKPYVVGDAAGAFLGALGDAMAGTDSTGDGSSSGSPDGRNDTGFDPFPPWPERPSDGDEGDSSTPDSIDDSSGPPPDVVDDGGGEPIDDSSGSPPDLVDDGGGEPIDDATDAPPDHTKTTPVYNFEGEDINPIYVPPGVVGYIWINGTAYNPYTWLPAPTSHDQDTNSGDEYQSPDHTGPQPITGNDLERVGDRIDSNRDPVRNDGVIESGSGGALAPALPGGGIYDPSFDSGGNEGAGSNFDPCARTACSRPGTPLGGESSGSGGPILNPNDPTPIAAGGFSPGFVGRR